LEPGDEGVLIGTGQETARVQQMLDEHPVPHLTWIPWVDYDALRAQIQKGTESGPGIPAEEVFSELRASIRHAAQGPADRSERS
jgi:hypothetical protein